MSSSSHARPQSGAFAPASQQGGFSQKTSYLETVSDAKKTRILHLAKDPGLIWQAFDKNGSASTAALLLAQEVRIVQFFPLQEKFYTVVLKDTL